MAANKQRTDNQTDGAIILVAAADVDWSESVKRRTKQCTHDYVVLRTMLLFSGVDVTLHAGGGTPGGCGKSWVQRRPIWANSGSTAIQRGDWLVGGANIDVTLLFC